MTFLAISSALLSVLGVASAYLWHVTRVLSNQVPEAKALLASKWTEEQIKETYQKHVDSPIDIEPYLPPKTGNRYIIVGGGGYLGGWMILHLLKRGEELSQIRILDVRPPARLELSKVPFLNVDITNPTQVNDAFSAPWPTQDIQSRPLTVIHTASLMRFYERHAAFLPLSSKVNVEGTQILLDAALKANTSYFLYTSSVGALLKETRLWPLPWETRLPGHLKVYDDNLTLPHLDESFSNYGRTKLQADILVLAHDRHLTASGTEMRTGSLRPGWVIYGSGGDQALEVYMRSKNIPSWVHHVVQNHIYVENASLAHLCYEQRLIDIQTSSKPAGPDIGGQGFLVTDPGKPITFGDLYNSLTVLTHGETQFHPVPAGLMLVVAYVVDWYYLARHKLGALGTLLLPSVNYPLVNLQPPLFWISTLHMPIDDSRARLPAADGGLGYTSPFTSLEGIAKSVQLFQAANGGGGGKGVHANGKGLPAGQLGVERIEEAVGLQDKAPSK